MRRSKAGGRRGGSRGEGEGGEGGREGRGEGVQGGDAVGAGAVVARGAVFSPFFKFVFIPGSSVRL